jgi:glutathione S-transferase
MKLYDYFRSSAAYRVRIALAMKGLAPERVFIHLRKGHQRGEDYLALNPHGLVPALVTDSGDVLTQSLAIVEYLDEVFPAPRMLPENLHDRARARQIMSWMRNDHGALRLERPTARIFYPAGEPPPPLSPAARRAADDLVRVTERLGADARGCLFGNRFGVVDIDVAFALMRLVATGIEIPEQLRGYVATVWARPSVREFIEHRRPPNAAD